jgi:hypothetical protein
MLASAIEWRAESTHRGSYACIQANTQARAQTTITAATTASAIAAEEVPPPEDLAWVSAPAAIATAGAAN